MSEYDTEPVPGLPQNLPEGETLLWQGSPDAKAVARRVLHANGVAIYFALLALVPFASAFVQNTSLLGALGAAARLAIIGGVAMSILTLLARAIARTTIYSLTTKRVVMRYGVAFPLSLNVPFSEIAAVDCKTYADGTADVALHANGPLRMSYLHLWPHARAWRFEHAQPTLRVLPNGGAVAQAIASAMVSAGIAGAKVRAHQPAEVRSTGVPGLSPAAA